MSDIFNALRTGASFNKKRFGSDIEFFKGAVPAVLLAQLC